MELPSYFTDFLAEIRPSQPQRKKMRDAHKKLRELLEADPELAPLIVATFVQGSYRRLTGNKPACNGKLDVDIIVVTTMHEDNYSPKQALEKFRPFLKKHYPGKHTLQGRSWGIVVDDEVTLDLVPTSAPSEAIKEALRWAKAPDWDFPDEPEASGALKYAGVLLEGQSYSLEQLLEFASTEQWQHEVLRIPDRESERWDDTHPLEQIRWTWQKSSATAGHFVNVVKSVKRWRQIKAPEPKHPKSYPLEHIVGNCCPDGISSVAEGVVRSLETMEATYRSFVDAGQVPHLGDRGVPAHNVLGRVSPEDFRAFMDHVRDAAALARRAFDCTSIEESANLWRELFGEEFPEPRSFDSKGGGGNGGPRGGFTPRGRSSEQIGEGRFA